MNLLERLERWATSRPLFRGSAQSDSAALAGWHETSASLLDCLAQRTLEASAARSRWRALVREAHQSFLRRHLTGVEALVGDDTLEQVLSEIARVFPSLLPTPRELAADAERCLADKLGVEYKTAILLSTLLATPFAGRQLMAGCRRPSPLARQNLARFQRTDQLDLGGARIRRDGVTALVELTSPASLNAEDDAVLDALEACVDLSLLDDRIRLGVLRGGVVTSAKYADRRVFCSGLNLSSLYAGKLPYLYYVRRELGLVSKLYRGLRLGSDGQEIEKPWIGAVDAHAIGGGCQLLLVLDHVIAERNATLSLPATAEGIIPGAAPLRLSRRLGERAATRTVLFGVKVPCDGERENPFVDQVVDRRSMDGRIRAATEMFATTRPICFAANRKALRLSHEPADAFQQYMSHFALAQADCHFSAELARNLEQGWVARRRLSASGGPS